MSNREERKPCVMICQQESCYKRGSAEVLKAFQTADLPEDAASFVGCVENAPKLMENTR